MAQRGQKIEARRHAARAGRHAYQRAALEFHNGTFRVRGDVVEIFPVYEESEVVRVEFLDDEIEALTVVDPLRGEVIRELDHVSIYPASHYITPRDKLEQSIVAIRAELEERLLQLRGVGKLLERLGSTRSTSSCWRSRASAPASRTTAATSTAASRARRRPRCSTTSPTTS